MPPAPPPSPLSSPTREEGWRDSERDGGSSASAAAAAAEARAPLPLPPAALPLLPPHVPPALPSRADGAGDPLGCAAAPLPRRLFSRWADGGDAASTAAAASCFAAAPSSSHEMSPRAIAPGSSNSEGSAASGAGAADGAAACAPGSSEVPTVVRSTTLPKSARSPFAHACSSALGSVSCIRAIQPLNFIAAGVAWLAGRTSCDALPTSRGAIASATIASTLSRPAPA